MAQAFVDMFVSTLVRYQLVALYTLSLSRTVLNGSSKVVRILCFGDSLTFGLTSSVPHPYTEKLQEYFNQKDQRTGTRNSSVRRSVELYNAGVAGERVQNEMPRRLRSILGGRAVKYNWVIILGGTNDLISMQSTWAPTKGNTLKDELAIFNAIVYLHAVAHSSGAKTVATTIPAITCGKGKETVEIPSIMEVRLKVNNRIRKFAANTAGNVLLADLDKKMLLPKDKMLCSDGVHLTAPAYDRMAKIMYDAIKEFV